MRSTRHLDRISTSTARILLPGTLGNSRSKIFVTFDARSVSSAATFVDGRVRRLEKQQQRDLFRGSTLLLMKGLSPCPIGEVCRSSNELARGRKAVFVEDRSEVLRIRIGNDLPLVAHGRQKRLDVQLGHARGVRTRQFDNAVLRLRSHDLGKGDGHIVCRHRLKPGRRRMDDVSLRTAVRDRIGNSKNCRSTRCCLNCASFYQLLFDSIAGVERRAGRRLRGCPLLHTLGHSG